MSGEAERVEKFILRELRHPDEQAGNNGRPHRAKIQDESRSASIRAD